MTDATYSIAIDGTSIPASSLMKIKKLTNLSLAEIKGKIQSHEALVTCTCIDDDELSLIKRLYDELETDGIDCQIYRCGQPEPYEFFENLLEMNRQINEEEYPD